MQMYLAERFFLWGLQSSVEPQQGERAGGAVLLQLRYKNAAGLSIFGWKNMAAVSHNTVIGLALADSTSMCIERASHTPNAASCARLTHMRALLSPHPVGPSRTTKGIIIATPAECSPVATVFQTTIATVSIRATISMCAVRAVVNPTGVSKVLWLAQCCQLHS